jgi:hypothetical protein
MSQSAKPRSLRVRRVRRSLPMLCLFCFLSPAAATRAELPGSLLDAVRGSGFIFRGTVKAIGAATPTVPAEARTAVVVVDQVIEVTPPLGDLTRREVTVRLRKAEALRPGEAAVFFTYLYRAGTSVGLEEVGWLPAAQADEVKRLDTAVRAARQELADEALARRLASAALVVTGVAGDPQPTEAARRTPVGEHDPLWWAAPIRVESVEKGQPGTAPVVALFPTSIDLYWEHSPRLKAGQRAIFLLQPDSRKQFSVPGLFLIDPLDVQTPDQLPRVRLLLRRTR